MGVLRLAILWHMHQPYYLDPTVGRAAMPWVRLHSLKDYLDMPLLAAEQPGITVNFNLVPSLLEQWRAWQNGVRDRIQELCARPPAALTPAERTELIPQLFRAHGENMISPWADYAELHRRWQDGGAESLSDGDLTRLKYWYHLAWLDPLFRSEPVPARLLEDPALLTEENWAGFAEYLDRFPARIFETYGRLHREGRIEVSVTPYYHPILPLLIDHQSAREAMPAVALPNERSHYQEDARWHLRAARRAAREEIGIEVAGVWPSEGSVSEDAIRLMSEEGFAWSASDEQVLAQSLGLPHLNMPGNERAAILYQPYRRRFGDRSLDLVFRDHFLSDRIGFTYASWDPERAVEDFIYHLRRIRDEAPQPEPLVSVILDGENCWEYYRLDGLPFLRGLYARLAEESWLHLDSLSKHLGALSARELGAVKAGSWINGNFSIWIGHSEDNRSWDYLARVRRELVERGGGAHPLNDGGLPPDLAKAWRSLMAAEGSDWNWWYGDDHSSLDDAEFDRLYRAHLRGVYAAMGWEEPDFLQQAIPEGVGRRGGMVPLGLSRIRVDGRESHFYEWENAACFEISGSDGAMTRVDRLVTSLWLAFGTDALYLRADLNADSPNRRELRRVSLNFSAPCHLRFLFDLSHPAAAGIEEFVIDRWEWRASSARHACDEILELMIPWTELPARAGQDLYFALTFLGEAGILEVDPTGYPLVFKLPDPDYDRIMWKV